MAVLLTVLAAIASGMAFMKRGLFSGACALIAVLFSAIAGVAFGAPVAHMTEFDSPYTYPLCVAAIAVLAFVVIRGLLIFIDVEVEFAPLVERAGGALTGAAAGLIAAAFVGLCGVLSPLPGPVAWLEQGMRHAAKSLLVSGHFATQLISSGGSWSLADIEAADPYRPAGLPRPAEPVPAAEPASPEAAPGGAPASESESVPQSRAGSE